MDSENHLRKTNTFHNKNNKQMRDRREQFRRWPSLLQGEISQNKSTGNIIINSERL